MILLGLRLTVSGGRDTVNSQNDRHAWLDTTPATRSTTSRHDPRWGRVTADNFDGQTITPP